MSDPSTLEVVRCSVCHVARFPPRARCPRCGGSEFVPGSVPARGTVLAVTALEFAAAGWAAPHPLVFVELEEGLRLLTTVADRPPSIGDRVGLRRDGDRVVTTVVG